MPKAKYDEAENKIETIELERLESKATRVWLLLPELPGCIKNGRSCQKCKLFFSLKQLLVCITLYPPFETLHNAHYCIYQCGWQLTTLVFGENSEETPREQQFLQGTDTEHWRASWS